MNDWRIEPMGNVSMRRWVVALAVALVGALVACSSPEQESQSADEPEPSATPQACAPAPFAPTYLPWGGPVGEPERYENGPDVILIWFGPLRQGDKPVHADLSTHYEAKPEGATTTVPVRGTEGSLSWNPKFSEMGLRWTERDEPCGHYSLFLTDVTQSKAWHEKEIAKIAGSLE